MNSCYLVRMACSPPKKIIIQSEIETLQLFAECVAIILSFSTISASFIAKARLLTFDLLASPNRNEISKFLKEIQPIWNQLSKV